jgi:Uma2 family endonuclease
MAETDWHRDLMLILIEMLRAFYMRQRVYVSGNLLVYYVPGDRRRHLSPDVFVVRGIENYQRPNYLIWEERHGPEVVIELTSSSTRREDLRTKFALYRDTLRVREYFLFDPLGDYLEPQLQGYRLRKGIYHPIRTVNGRLRSHVLGLHLEHFGQDLRLWDPKTEQWLPTPSERQRQAEQRAETAEQRAETAERRADREARTRTEAEADRDRMQQELEELRRRLNGSK